MGVNSLLFLPIPLEIHHQHQDFPSTLLAFQEKAEAAAIAQRATLSVLKATKQVTDSQTPWPTQPLFADFVTFGCLSSHVRSPEDITATDKESEPEQGLWKAQAVLRCLICFSCSPFHLLPPKTGLGLSG